ncbi:hypothetical protein MPSEU_000792700 [Mayamaea pseudoterrestris]|nr:hypothetical protein MPSEU_000792700 [Mayamaea pseudoterrestris]
MSQLTSNTKHESAAFEVYVSKDTFKFNAAHFVAFKGYRERLHGHNYRVGVRLFGDRKIGADGYVIDFGCIKDVCKKICKQLNEHFLCPMHSDVLTIAVDNDSVKIQCEDGSQFQFPKGDCALLPIVHATTEELAIYLYAEILNGLDAAYLVQRGLHTMEITVAEAPGQEATFRLAIPVELDTMFKLDVREFIVKGDIIPIPCVKDSQQGSCPNCRQSQLSFTSQLE